MANNSPKHNPYGFIDKRQGRSGNQQAMAPATHDNLKDVTAMRARLTAINSTTYNATVLDTMTQNDMLYAIRLNDEAGSI